jgi:predicted ribosomally synthesized peptide with SipW-like signal peptide
MNTRTVRLSRFSAAACATAITAVSTWAFMSSTASIERNPFQLEWPHSNQVPEEIQVYGLPDLLAPPPACLSGCA